MRSSCHTCILLLIWHTCILLHRATDGGEEGVYEKFMNMLVQLVKGDIETSKFEGITCVYVYICMYVCVCVWMYVCVCVCVRARACNIYICIYIHTYIHTHI